MHFSSNTNILLPSSDAFVLNFGALDWEPSRMQDGYDAASAAGFKMFLSFDMTSLTCGSWADTASISSTIVRWANHAAQLKDSTGAVYVGTFSGENCWFGQGDFAAGWTQAVKTGPGNSGVKTKFIPSFFPVGSHGSMFPSFMDGTFPVRRLSAFSSLSPIARLGLLNGYYAVF